jgi:DNA segregation ATPase FtsK/SpoIIIE-like protein
LAFVEEIDMTAQDAFAIAFDDEAWAMDAMPGNDMPRNNLPSKPSAPSGLKKNAAAAPGATTSMGVGGQDDMSISEHMMRYHPDGFDPSKNKCKLFDSMVSSLTAQGMSKEDAWKRATQIHNGTDSGSMPQQPQQPQPPDPAMQEQQVQQLAQNPQAIESAPSEMLANPEVVNTAAGEIPVQTTVQKAIVENLDQQAAQGNQQAGEALSELKENVDDGTITQEAHNVENPLVEQPQQPADVQMASSDGSFVHTLSPEESAVIQANPEKREVLQQIVDASGKYVDSTDEAEKEQIAEGIRMLYQMFYGEKNPKNASGEEPKEKETVKVLEFEATDDKGNKSTGIIEADSRIDAIRKLMKKGLKPTNLSNEPFDVNKDDLSTSTPPPSPPTPPTPPEGGGGESGGPNPPNNPPNPPDNPPDEDDDDSRSTLPPAPSDEEFRVGENKYKVGGITYTDVSGKGLFRTALASFMAGLRGEGVITGWDRINGTWDAMKRSEKGEMVRDGIASALCRDTIANYANKDGLSDDAKMEIAVIQDMMNQADTPEAQMKAIKQFQKWKETYSKELGELEKPIPGQTFKPLPNDYKGTKPPVSILKKSEGFEADKEFGDKVAAGLQERLGILGFQIDELVGVSVGPSATTVKFKIPPTFDMTAANSKKTREALKGAIGTEVSNVEYAKGEKDVMSITVTNPEMRNVSFSDVINSQKWKTFAKKAALPIPVGRDSSGEETMLDAATMPQTIVTGATGSGKSVFISAAINGIEMEKTPDEARIVLLDPKNEFKIQDGSPHLLFPRAGGDPDKAKASKDMADVLDSLVAIMNDRVTKIGGVIEGFNPSKNEFKGAAEHSIKQYNEAHPDDKMPHILLVFDEIANARDNATAADKARIDVALQKLTAVGRSVGVNCLLATQRDDVGSIPGIIQANCPGRVTFKASPTDAKASQEAKALAGNGDYILTDKAGNKTRGRGCFISPEEEMAIPSYYRDHMAGGDNPAEPTLPKEYTDGIVQAVEKGVNLSVEAMEGLEDAFKAAVPNGWTVTKEKVDGKEYWKASPPKPTRVDVKEAKKPEADKAKGEKPKGLNLKSRQEAIESIKAMKDEAISKADADYEKDGNLDKYEKALQKIGQEEQRHMAIVNTRFPEMIENGDETDDDEGQENPLEQPDVSNTESSEDDGDTPAAMMKDVEAQLKAEKERIDKALSKPTLKLRDRRKLRQEKAALQKRFDDAKAKFKAGGTADEILNIFEPEEKKEEPEKIETAPQSSDEDVQVDAETVAANEQDAKNEKLRNSVPPQKGYSEKTIAGSAPAKNRFGVIFVNDPKTGSQGRLIPDPKNPKGYKFQKDIDTTHPEYKGYIKKPDGTWELSPEAKKVEEETRLDRKQSRDAKKREEALKRFNRARFGHDEAPDNKTIVANAVMEALKLVEG